MKSLYIIKNIDHKKKIEEINVKLEKNSNNPKLIEMKKKLQFYIDNKVDSYVNNLQLSHLQTQYSYLFISKLFLDYVNFWEKYNEEIFFNYFLDFRGRFYCNSMVSPCQGWPFRFIYGFKNNFYGFSKKK